MSLVFLPVTCQQSVPLGWCTCWSSGCVHLHTLFQSTLSVQSPRPLGLCCSIQLCQCSAVEECVWLKLLEVELVSRGWISRHKLTDHFQYCIVLLIIPPHVECLRATVETMEQCPSLHRACNKWAGLPSFSTQPGLHCGIVRLVLYSRGTSTAEVSDNFCSATDQMLATPSSLHLKTWHCRDCSSFEIACFEIWLATI